MLASVAVSQGLTVNFMTDEGHFVDSEFINIGCAGTTNHREFPDANNAKVHSAQIEQLDAPCALTVWCGDEVGMMTSKDIDSETYGGDPPLVDNYLCGDNDYWVLSYVGLCNCDDGTGSG